MPEIVIRGGTVIDGTGAPGRVADVTISGGVIEEIGPNLQGERELDASGCSVTPGFIDIHTHYDAQVFWDPALRPTSYHGVTTVVAGNCGFAIAPDPPRAPRHDRAHARERRGHGSGDPDRGDRLGVRDVPGVPGSGPQPRDSAQLHRLRRPLPCAALRDGGRGVRADRDSRRGRADEPARARGDRAGRGRVLDQLLVRPPRGRRQAGAQPLRRPRRGALPVRRRGRRRQGRRAHHPG